MSKNDVGSVTNALLGSNDLTVANLGKLGHLIIDEWHEFLKNSTKKIPISPKFSSDPIFKKFLATQLQIYIDNAKIERIQNIQELKNKLIDLHENLIIWKDNPENDSLNSSQKSEAEKKLRQETKSKSTVDKNERYAINIGLQSLVFILCQQSDFVIETKEENKKKKERKKRIFVTRFEKLSTKKALSKFVSKRIRSLNYHFKLSNEEPSNIQQKVEKKLEEISAHQTPNIKKKIIKYTGKIVALLASIACGLTTGGAIYLLGPSFLALAISLGIFTILVALTFNRRFTGIAISLVCGLVMGATVYSLGLLLTPGLALLFSAITLGLLTGIFGFTANFGFFSKNFPGFLLNLVKKAGISEFIDNNGNRKQFSANYKYLLIPLITFSSLTVGAGTVALTYITILSLFTKLATILPILALVWPPLPLIIAGVLAGAVGIALTVAVLTASLDILKKVAALNLGFVPLCKYAYESCKNWVADLRNLNARDIIGLVILLLLLPVALGGLAYFRYTAGIDLSAFIGATGAIVMGVVAYIAQMAFICLSVNKLKNAIINPSAASNDFSALTVNAVGNGVLVYDGSPSSFAGMISCSLNSFCGNMSEPDLNKEFRSRQTAKIIEEVENFNTKVKTEPSASINNFEPNQRNLNLNGFPIEEPSNGLPSPTRSDNGLFNNGGYSALIGQTLFPIPKGSNSSTVEANSRLAPAATH